MFSNFEFGDVVTTIHTGLSFGYSPHFEYNLNERFALLLNLPINFLGVSYDKVKTESLSQKFSTNEGDLIFFPSEFILKLGLEYQL